MCNIFSVNRFTQRFHVAGHQRSFNGTLSYGRSRLKTRARANRQRDSELRAHRLPALDAARVGALPRRLVSPGASAAAAAATTAAAETQSRAFAVTQTTSSSSAARY